MINKRIYIKIQKFLKSKNLTLLSLKKLEGEKEYFKKLSFKIRIAFTEVDSLFNSSNNFYKCICLDDNSNSVSKIIYIKSYWGYFLTRLEFIEE